MECPTKMFGFNCGLEEQSRRACIIAQFSLEDTHSAVYLSVCTLITARGSLRPAVFLRMLVRNFGERRAFLPTSKGGAPIRAAAITERRPQQDRQQRKGNEAFVPLLFRPFTIADRPHEFTRPAGTDRWRRRGGPLKIT